MAQTTCPVNHDFDPVAPGYLADPYSVLESLRAEQPVFYSPDLAMYVVTRYEDIERILMDPKTFSSTNAVTPLWPVDEQARATLATAFERVPTLTNADGERHAVMRRHVARCLSPRRIKAIRPMVEARAADLLDAMLAKETADFYRDLAYPLPALTAFRLLGFPESDTELLKSWVTDRQMLTWGHAAPEQQREIAVNIVAFSDYIEQFVKRRLDDPQDDVVSELVQVHRDDPAGLTLLDIANITFLLSAGAHESTTNLITHGVRRLLENPREWAQLCADESLVPGAIEEALRYDASAIAWPRITAEDTEIGGHHIPAGSPLLLVLGSANRDERQFSDAIVFDIARDNARQHLSFGKGIHFCLGAPLARMEMDVVLRLLRSRVPELRLVADQSFPYHANAVMRSPQELLVHTGAVGSSHASRDPGPHDAKATPQRQQLPVEVDPNICIGSGECLLRAPHAFALESSTAVVLPGVADLESSAIDAIIAACPSGAIRKRPDLA